MNCQNSGGATGSILGSIFGGLCVCGVAILACIKCKCCNFKLCSCHKYNELKKIYNQVDQNSMSN